MVRKTYTEVYPMQDQENAYWEKLSAVFHIMIPASEKTQVGYGYICERAPKHDGWLKQGNGAPKMMLGRALLCATLTPEMLPPKLNANLYELEDIDPPASKKLQQQLLQLGQAIYNGDDTSKKEQKLKDDLIAQGVVSEALGAQVVRDISKFMTQARAKVLGPSIT